MVIPEPLNPSIPGFPLTQHPEQGEIRLWKEVVAAFSRKEQVTCSFLESHCKISAVPLLLLQSTATGRSAAASQSLPLSPWAALSPASLEEDTAHVLYELSECAVYLSDHEK